MNALRVQCWECGGQPESLRISFLGHTSGPVHLPFSPLQLKVSPCCCSPVRPASPPIKDVAYNFLSNMVHESNGHNEVGVQISWSQPFAQVYSHHWVVTHRAAECRLHWMVVGAFLEMQLFAFDHILWNEGGCFYVGPQLFLLTVTARFCADGPPCAAEALVRLPLMISDGFVWLVFKAGREGHVLWLGQAGASLRAMVVLSDLDSSPTTLVLPPLLLGHCWWVGKQRRSGL